ncbi:LysR family transcriptional regulator [Agromyces luteolus]|uniref:LysR family transcriptional regulator n=1 Tax=Agromyces luteolus TaxID=88373 RepID=A0A7C9HMZ4_9MICO|nr:LysR substrate-binding domain-containing protein [Agromyces luteolus]MUN08262.1 LysR family transcriptional regulator [Agromyces luteolus]GLK26795.1 LysR family transcriptional regulator [Agromyces luteolus]
MLDLRRISLLVAVQRFGSIAAAAADAGCTPSSASEQLSKLESELGLALLERSPRSVRLTHAGSELAEHGRALLAQAELAERAAKDVAGVTAGRVRVAAYQTAAARFVIPAIASFAREHPRVRVSFEELEPEDGMTAVAEGTADVALVSSYLGMKVPRVNGIEVVDLGEDPFVLVAPTRLATRSQTASLREFAKAQWISGRPEQGFQAITELAAARSGFTPEIVARVDNYDLILDLVAAGLGVALVPSSAVSSRAGVHAHRITEPFGLVRLESLASRAADHSLATGKLCALIRRRFNEAG